MTIKKYQKIANEIKDRIISGYYSPYENLPTQKELMEEFSTTSVTLQKALSILSMEGLIISRQGQGMRIIDPQKRDDLQKRKGSNYIGFANQMKHNKLDFRNKMCRFSVELSSLEISNHLHIPEHTPVYVIERLRILSDEPLIYETSFIPVALVAGLTEEIAENSIYEFIVNQLEIHIAHRMKTFRADIPTSKDRIYLECSEHEAILVIEETNIKNDGLPIEFSISRSLSSARTYTIIEDFYQT